MKAVLNRSFLLLVFLLSLGSQHAFGQTFWIDSFEDTTPDLGGGTRSVPAGHDSLTDGTFCAPGDYFLRTNMTSGAPLEPSGYTIDFSANVDGSFIWRAEDLDDVDCAGKVSWPETISWAGINISGMTNLIIAGNFAASNTAPFETGDFIRLEYNIDAGGWITALEFLPTAASNALLEEVVSGTDLSPTLTLFSFSTMDTGALMELRVTVSVDGGSEEIALDLFQVGGNNVLPVELQSFEIE